MANSTKDTYAIRCSRCYKVFGSLAHLNLYGERICNHCCPTALFSSVPVGEESEFLGCSCMNSKKVITIKNQQDVK